MAILYPWKNSSKAEGAANTIGVDHIEVPESAGAKSVHILSVELDPDGPDYVAAANTATKAVCIAGKVTPTTCNLSNEGAVTTKSVQNKSTGAAIFACVNDGPDQARGRWAVPKAVDGKYFVTIAVLGSNNTAAKTVHYRIDFEVEV
jgi:ribosomal protein S8E